MIQSRPIFDRLSALADPTRSRLLLLLDRHELTVGELCSALQLPQSTVSRHLRTLSDEHWVTARAEGTSRRYTMPGADLDGSARRLWHLVREQVGAGALGALRPVGGPRLRRGIGGPDMDRWGPRLRHRANGGGIRSVRQSRRMRR